MAWEARLKEIAARQIIGHGKIGASTHISAVETEATMEQFNFTSVSRASTLTRLVAQGCRCRHNISNPTGAQG